MKGLQREFGPKLLLRISPGAPHVSIQVGSGATSVRTANGTEKAEEMWGKQQRGKQRTTGTPPLPLLPRPLLAAHATTLRGGG
jgi:hypothetical protein